MTPDSPSPRSPLKPMEFLALAVLLEAPLHGYGIVQQIEARTGGRVQLRPGDVYRVIYRLEERGLLQKGEPDLLLKENRPAGDGDRAVEDASARQHERRTYYAITEAGRTLVHAEAEMLAEVSAGVVASATARGAGR
jgi:DNA-binding PadR family transcriptional regulator